MKIVFGNLKMNFLLKDFLHYSQKLNEKLSQEPLKTKLGLAIPYIYLEKASDVLGPEISVLAQDLHQENSGAFTSSISADQLNSINVKATLIGHSECRILNQSAFIIEKKVKAALSYGFEVVYCCGANPFEEIETELGSLSEEEMKNIVIAYEPLSAIGTGQALNDEEADKKLSEIRKFVSQHWSEDLSKNIKLLYGGSVNLTNYKNYLKHNNIDGILVGGASLKVDDLWSIATLK